MGQAIILIAGGIDLSPVLCLAQQWIGCRAYEGAEIGSGTSGKYCPDHEPRNALRPSQIVFP